MSSDEIKNRIVYMLRRTDGGNEIYIGSTSIPLKKRYMVHMYNAKNFIGRGSRLYARMNEIGLDNWRISPLVSRMCDMKTICEEEKEWIGVLNAALNTISPVNEDVAQKEYDRRRSKKNIVEKRYHCELCDISFRHSNHLKNHLGTLKHSHAWLNSVD